jgi:SAM-dependent methyltransferase
MRRLPVTASGRCPACESAESTQSYAVRHYRYVKCAGCGLMYLPAVAPAGSAAAANHYGLAYFGAGVGTSMSGYMDYAAQSVALRRNFRRLLRRLLRHVPNPREGRSLLDIGCAYGFLLDEARKVGFRVAGLDVSEAAIRWMEGSLGIRGTAGSLGEVSLGRFDVITVVEALEHVESPGAFLSNVRRHLRPGGILLIGTGANDSLVARILGSRWWYLNPPDHCRIYSRPALARLVGGSGFRILEHSLYPMHWVGLNNMTLKIARVLERPALSRAAGMLPALVLPIVHYTTQVLVAVRRE